MSNYNPYAPMLETQLPRMQQAPLATLWKRFAGAMLDGLVAFGAMLPGFIPLAISMAQQDPNSQAPDLDTMGIVGIIWILVIVLVLAILQIYLLVTRSQTIGKYLVNTQIVEFETGVPAGFMKTFVLRSFVSGLIGAIPFVGFIYPLVDILFIFRADRRCIHDLIAGTNVVDISS